MIKYLIEKEFKQFMRNPFLPKLVILLPSIFMLLLPWAANMEITNINLAIVDHDHSSYSMQLIEKLENSKYFNLTDAPQSYPQALEGIEKGSTDIILEIPTNFERDLIAEGKSNVLIAANAVNGVKGGIGSTYLSTIVRNFNAEIAKLPTQKTAGIQIHTADFFNPFMDYKFFMIPALVVMLLTILCGFLPALNIVGEKELGTIEQINVSPVKKYQFMLGKLIPYWIIGFIVLSICLGLSYLIYGLFPEGSFAVIYLSSALFFLVMAGFGLLISSNSDNLQQAMFVMFFFILILILISGLFTPVSSMPSWAQGITFFNPIKYFITIMRGVFLKGSTLFDIRAEINALIVFAIVMNIWAILSYRKRG